jgi:hypothetical protein
LAEGDFLTGGGAPLRSAPPLAPPLPLRYGVPVGANLGRLTREAPVPRFAGPRRVRNIAPARDP